MEATQSLAREHRLILRTLEAFEAYVGYVDATIEVDRFDLQRFIAFFRDFSGLNHHDKEEALFFPTLLEAGLDWNAGPLARLRREHDQEQYLMQSLEHSALQGQAWSADERQHFLNIAKEFIAFQRNHVRFENTEVYPRAELLSETTRARLTRELARFDDSVRVRNERLVELAEILMRCYGPSERSGVRNAGGPLLDIAEPRERRG
jgi:hemerythrin-like domain-containing protein